MKRSLMVMGLLSVVGTASLTAPALSDTAIPTQDAPLSRYAGHVDDHGAVLRLAQAGPDRGEHGQMSQRGKDWAGTHRCCAGEGPGMGRMGQMGGMGRMGGHGGPHHRQPAALRIAATLAQTETYVGITSAQLDAWRAYTSALIDFFERPARDRGPAGAGSAETPPPSPAQGQAGPASTGAAPTLLADRLADRVIARADKARALKTALDALRAQLTPEQLDRLARAERAFHPGMQGHGMQGPGMQGHGRIGPRQGSRAGMEPMSPEGSPEDMSDEAPEDMPAASPEDMSPENPEDMPSETPDDMPEPQE